ncbi:MULTISPECIES: septation ring formation regulator EzrA [Aerococcus]|uniref:septation ring formation regulator EzrA n=1 Tax=Aerococcus TaxID=1375 RepID=UPI0018A78C61|nr:MULTISPECIES: septation ring formation regulator EzrA [Aerococcus]MCY3036565.1 septation ring formation regulator EzrA [Aerococcus sp. Group 2]MCY3039526.1 septation ring formation regulator EzrA [Aerococcus sp. Group 2]MCY3041428.1 septation ring formation regulator EzrA [Aerococcus sp. Group 2]MCY3042980.1 septation ring formation regulator EzrA [Aerococcus sp. Group 2]MDK6520621.1 septation ring formation regulator EzrA [Aerococcus urinae]
MGFIIALIIIIVIILIGYGLLYYLGRKQSKTNLELDEKKQEIMAIPVADKLYTIRNKNVSGNTRRLFEAEQAKWQTIKQYKLPEIEAALVQAQADADKFSLIKSRKTAEETEKLIYDTLQDVQNINQSLEELLASESKNEAYFQEVNDRYAKIRKQLLAHGYAYGDSQETLEKHLSYIELDFTKYNTLMSDADYLAAHDVLDQTKEDIEALEAMMEEIPKLLDKIDNEYEEQLEDLKSGYSQMLAMDFQFPSGVRVDEEIQQVEKGIEQCYAALAECDLSETSSLMSATEAQIDRSYELMEVELRAKEYIEKNQGNLEQRINQVRQSNRYGSLEIDRVSQNYLLHDNELGKLQDYADQIDRIHEEVDTVNQRLGAHVIAYTDMQSVYKDKYEQLNEIDKAQSHIVGSLANLRQKERDARDMLYTFDLDMRNMKRRVNQYHLPGLPDAYLDRYFATEDKVEELERKMNRVKLDMDEIDQLVNEVSEAIERLDLETENMIDQALLTEQTVQYANRYRANHPELNQAIEKSSYYFNQTFDYKKAHQTISQAVDQLESGASNKVENQYRQEKEERLY